MTHSDRVEVFEVLDVEDDDALADYPTEIELQPASPAPSTASSSSTSPYDFVFKFLLVGDSDVGKEEILTNLEDDGEESAENYRSHDVAYKSTSILLCAKRVKLHIWNTSGQGRFSTILNTYSRGAQGIILVYDITNKWSFRGLDRWIQEIDKHAPGVPKILIGNRKHLEFRRQISEKHAKAYATKHNMAFLEVSPLCNFNVQESCAELSRLVLERNGMKNFWTSTGTLSTLQELCYRRIVSEVNAYDIENLPLPPAMKSYLKSFSSTVQSNYSFESQLAALKKQKCKRKSFASRCSRLLFNSPPKCDKSAGSSPGGSGIKSLRRLLSFISPTRTHDDGGRTPPAPSHQLKRNSTRQTCVIS